MLRASSFIGLRQVRIPAVIVIWIACLSSPLMTQAQDAFDAVVIRPRSYAAEVLIRFDVNPKFLRARGTTLRDLITKAFEVEDDQLSGIADWMATERYDIDATSGEAVERTQMMAMLRNVLMKRFHLVAHHETREAPVFALVVDNGGSKLAPLGPRDNPQFFEESHNQVTRSIGSSIQDLIRALNSKTGDGALGKRVVDRTGLQGLYRIRLTFDVEPDPDGGEVYKIDFPSALRRLGLRLEPAKAPIDVLVIDTATRPKFDGR